MPDIKLCAMDKTVSKSWFLPSGRKQENQWFKIQCNKRMHKGITGVWKRWVHFLLTVN